MKPFLGIDITVSKKNEYQEGQEFIVASTSEAQVMAAQNAIDDANDLEKKAQLPLVLRIVMYVCGVLGMLVFGGILRATNDVDSIPISEMYQNGPWLFWGMGICLAVAGLLFLLNRRKQTVTMETDESQYTIDKMEKICAGVFDELGVPENAKEVDMLIFTYKVKNGLPVAKEVGFKFTPYMNQIVRIFSKDNQFYIANVEHKYAFPLSELRGIRTIKKNISIPTWNKEDAHPTSDKYKKYKMQVDNYGCIHFKPYHILELEHNGEIWGIYFPCYELEVFEKVTGLKAE